jgi:hypothetical protein
VRLRVAELAGRDLSHAADAAVEGELVLLLDALAARKAGLEGCALAIGGLQCSVRSRWRAPAICQPIS